MIEIHQNNWDVIIVGAGPSGLFCAKTLKKLIPNLHILLIDQGMIEKDRKCNAIDTGRCLQCDPCNIACGFGGAGLFSDGKLCLDLSVGGHQEVLGVCDEYSLKGIVDEVERGLLAFDGESYYKDVDATLFDAMCHKANSIGMGIKGYPVRHFSSSILQKILTNIRINGLNNINILTNTKLIDITFKNHHAELILKTTNKMNTATAKVVVLAVGKYGSLEIVTLLDKFGICSKRNRIAYGLRVEGQSKIFDDFFKIALNPKISKIFPDGIEMKTHCFCRNGKISLANYQGYPIACGHTSVIYEGINGNTNFAIMTKEGENIGKEVDLGKYLNKFRLIDGNKLSMQRFGDFLIGAPTKRESIMKNSITPTGLKFSEPGILNNMFPFDCYDNKFIDFIFSLNLLVPGIAHEDTMLYGPALEWWMPQIDVNCGTMETKISGLYAIGDGAGVSQGIVFSAGTGIIAARHIATKFDRI